MSSQITINYSSSSSSSPATSAASSKVFQIIEGLDPFDEGVSKTLTKALVEGADPLTVDSSTNYSLLYRAAELGKNEVILQLLSTKENGNIDAVCGEKKGRPSLLHACEDI